jgi:DNA-binding CsgD family transcriptional regulator
MSNFFDTLHTCISWWIQTSKQQAPPLKQANHYFASIARMFNATDHYFFILNLTEKKLEYVHPSVHDILGCKPSDFNLAYLLKRMPPQDASKVQYSRGGLHGFFFPTTIENDASDQMYCCTFKIQVDKGIWKHILHRCVVLPDSLHENVRRVVAIHSDLSFPSTTAPQYSEAKNSNHPIANAPGALVHNFTFSDREQDIISLLANGLTSKSIGVKLGISKNTVDTHRRNILRKFRLNNLQKNIQP